MNVSSIFSDIFSNIFCSIPTDFVWGGSKTNFRSLSAKVKLFFAENRRRTAVVGLSGGVDSALTCALLAKALGSKRVFAVYLPYFNDVKAEGNARAVAKLYGVHFDKISIRRPVDSLVTLLKCDGDVKRKGNLMARVRMAALYDIASKRNALVAGTGNKSELSTGYFTKYGDGGADFLPIGGLLKRDVRRIALHASVPREIVFQTPTAGLWPGQSDERELGLSYSELDGILELAGKRKIPAARREFGSSKVSKVLALIKSSGHKRRTPAIL